MNTEFDNFSLTDFKRHSWTNHIIQEQWKTRLKTIIREISSPKRNRGLNAIFGL